MLEWAQLERLLGGAAITVQVTVFSALLGTVLSIAGGVASMSASVLLRAVTRVYVELFRGVSAVILLFWVFFTVPILFDLRLSPIEAGVLALGLNMGAYGTEIARGAIQAIPKGQTEATVALNLTTTQRLRHVILPQAVVIMLPPYGNLFIELLKGTALVSLISASDLLFEAQQLRTVRAASSIAIFGTVLVMYFALSLVLTGLVRFAEARVGQGVTTGRGSMMRAR
jgi:polar amino acid transport system permease protein